MSFPDMLLTLAILWQWHFLICCLHWPSCDNDISWYAAHIGHLVTDISWYAAYIGHLVTMTFPDMLLTLAILWQTFPDMLLTLAILWQWHFLICCSHWPSCDNDISWYAVHIGHLVTMTFPDMLFTLAILWQWEICFCCFCSSSEQCLAEIWYLGECTEAHYSGCTCGPETINYGNRTVTNKKIIQRAGPLDLLKDLIICLPTAHHTTLCQPGHNINTTMQRWRMKYQNTCKTEYRSLRKYLCMYLHVILYFNSSQK